MGESQAQTPEILNEQGLPSTNNIIFSCLWRKIWIPEIVSGKEGGSHQFTPVLAGHTAGLIAGLTENWKGETTCLLFAQRVLFFISVCCLSGSRQRQALQIFNSC